MPHGSSGVKAEAAEHHLDRIPNEMDHSTTIEAGQWEGRMTPQLGDVSAAVDEQAKKVRALTHGHDDGRAGPLRVPVFQLLSTSLPSS